ncbi:MAG: NAD-dependent epimerase/dehydratase family protein [Candidatus Hodarchaeales archaeon]|jgi:UDP-glucose 4-epimerase
MKYMVTGGAGFVGSHLIQQLITEKHKIVCLDDFSTGKRGNLAELTQEISVIEGDIRDPQIIKKSLDNVDYVFHLAAQISVTRSTREPLFDASVNIEGMINLLEGIRQSSVKRIIYVSTGGAIYGEPNFIPAPENTPEEPISPYGLSKLVAEKYLKWFHEVYGISYSIIRPANIYGPRQDPMGEAGVISIFLGKISNNMPVEIFGDGTDTRDYVYVKDITDICLKAMNSTNINTYNAGTGKQTSLLDLVNIIQEVTQKEVKKKFSPPRAGDVKHISLDISRVEKELEWIPSTNLIDGIRETWNWYVRSQT